MAGYFRLWRRAQIVPGVRLNLSKSGVSMTLGPRGAHYTIGPRGTRATLGLPGTGLSYTSYSGSHARRATSRRTASGTALVPATSPASQAVRTEHEPMLPVAKIGVGIALLLTGIVLLVVPFIGLSCLATGAILLLVGLSQRRKPEWKIRALLHQARHHPDNSADAISRALAVDPNNPEALAAAATVAFAGQSWPEAAAYYESYLAKAPGDWRAEAHLAISHLNAGNPDSAILHLQHVCQLSVLPDETRVTMTNALAAAFLQKGDGEQALQILKNLPLQRRTLDHPLDEALYLRALSHYQKGERSQALSDLDRLYALHPDYPNLQQVKEAITAGTFSTKAMGASTDNV